MDQSITNIFLIVCCACAGWMVSEGTGLVQYAKWRLKISGRLKPFDCALCMSFWIALTVFIIRDGVTLYSVLFALTAAFIGLQISLKKNG